VIPLLEGLYDALARGQPLTDALQATKLAALRRGASARDWAALVIVGDPVVTVALEAPARRGWWVAAGAAATLLVGVGVALRARHTRRRHARDRATPGSS
jgi:hypothetical protein